MAALGLAIAVWLAIHVLVPATIRPALVARLGLQRYIPLFALSSLAAMTGMVLAYRDAPYVALWTVPAGVSAAAWALVGVAFALVAAGVAAANPATARGEAAGQGADALPVAGIVRITRHPVMSGIALWAFVHATVNGHLAALMLFGALLFTAINGMAALDRRRRLALGAAWDDFAARTSRLPFAAVATGRVALCRADLPWRPAAVGVAVFGAVLHLHQWAFGVPPWIP